MNGGFVDVGVVADFECGTDFWPLGVRSRCGCGCLTWLPSAGLLRAYVKPKNYTRTETKTKKKEKFMLFYVYDSRKNAIKIPFRMIK